MRQKITHAVWKVTALRPMLCLSLVVLLVVASTGAVAGDGVVVGTTEEGDTMTGP
jgi:hypothetical protein